ncbi:MAG TPA: hypothetical protein PK893_00515 [Candidatus Competibacteraceae bacterium]|nr:hypothetical protein [Candidatus Competibacteraceae bacterium]HQD54881.1 hypothetical protein [Candidatus Competibacteraceae bacterium]
MHKIKESLSVIFIIMLLFILIWFCWKLIFIFIEALTVADSKITIPVIGGIITIIVGLIANLYTQKQIKLREIDEAHRSKKVEIYSNFLEIVRRIISGNNKNIPIKPLKEGELILQMTKFRTEIILWSSPSVINAFRNFESIAEENTGIKMLLPAVDRLYREMRKDIGLSNKGLPQNQLVKIYLKDPSELDRALTNVDP